MSSTSSLTYLGELGTTNTGLAACSKNNLSPGGLPNQYKSILSSLLFMKMNITARKRITFGDNRCIAEWNVTATFYDNKILFAGNVTNFPHRDM
ncbi:Interleukin-1 receptor-like [Trichinella pseudospiralis]